MNEEKHAGLMCLQAHDEPNVPKICVRVRAKLDRAEKMEKLSCLSKASRDYLLSIWKNFSSFLNEQNKLNLGVNL